MLREDHRGLTLVELLVAIVIGAIVVLSVSGFMVVGARTFTSTSSEVNLQHESQIAYNQLQDLIIDTTLGIDYVYIAEGETTEIKILSDADIPSGTVLGEKRIYIYNDTIAYAIIWDVDARELFYEEYDVTYSSTGGASFGSPARVAHALMAEFITEFGIDVTRLEKKNIVRVDMAFERANRNYSASYNITVRNQVVVNGDPASFTPTLPVPDGLTSKDFIYVEPGRSYELAKEAEPKVTSLTDPTYSSSEVIWRLGTGTGAPTSARTGIDIHSGRLSVSSAEPGGDFQVVIAAKTGSASKTVTVYVVRVESITFPADAFEKADIALDENNNSYYYDDMKAGETFSLKAYLDGPNVAQACVTDAAIHYVDWAAATGSVPYVEAISGSESCTTGIVAGKTVGIVTCEFIMKEADDLVLDAKNPPSISIEATSQRSIDEPDRIYPYQNEAGINTPVIGKWEAGKYYKKPYDWFNPDRLSRKGQPNIDNIDRYSDKFNKEKYLFIYDLKVTENLHMPDGKVKIPKFEFRYEELSKIFMKSDKETVLKLNLKDNDWLFNPNADYVIEFVCYAIPTDGEHKSKSVLLGSNIANLYSIQGAAVAGSYKETMSRVNIYFDGEKHAKYIPREFGIEPSEKKFVEYAVATKEGEYHKEDSTNDLDIYNSKERCDISFYKYEGGKWEPYPTPGMFEKGQFTAAGNGQLNFRCKLQEWTEGMPSHLRLIPTVKDNKGTPYLMFDSYIDVYTWNIKVDKSWMGLGNNKGICTEECYFPCPSDWDFPGVTTSGTKGEWKYPYTTTKAKGDKDEDAPFSTIRNTVIPYSIIRVNNADSTYRYYLTLCEPGTVNEIGTYYCDSNARVWTKQ